MRPDREYVHQEIRLLVERLYFEENLPLETIIASLASELGTMLGSAAKPEALETALTRMSDLTRDFAHASTPSAKSA